MNITEKEILNDIRELLAADYPDVEITMETMLEYGSLSSLDMTSLEIIQFIVNLEEKFDIVIDIDDRYYTIGDAVVAVAKYIEEKKKE